MNISGIQQPVLHPHNQRSGVKSPPFKSKEELAKLVDRWAKEDDIYEARMKAKQNPLVHNPIVQPMLLMVTNAKNALKKWVVGPSAGTVNGTTQHDLQK
jgi:hypothetical protein